MLKSSVAEEVKAINTKGNNNFRTQLLNDDLNGYVDNTVFQFEGLIDTSITLNQTVTQIGADNNPNFRTIKGPITTSGSIHLYGIALKDFEKLFSIEYDKDYGLRVGQNVPIKHLTVSFDENVVEDGSINKVILYDCIFSLPNITTKTDDGSVIGDFTVQFTGSPLMYRTVSGTEKQVTYAIINNKDNPVGWDENKDMIQFPEEWVQLDEFTLSNSAKEGIACFSIPSLSGSQTFDLVGGDLLGKCNVDGTYEITIDFDYKSDAANPIEVTAMLHEIVNNYNTPWNAQTDTKDIQSVMADSPGTDITFTIAASGTKRIIFKDTMEKGNKYIYLIGQFDNLTKFTNTTFKVVAMKYVPSSPA